MGKTARIKSDLEDTNAMVEVFQILKDIAANHFYNTAKRKEAFVEFAETFSEFFRMVSLADATSPLVHSRSDRVAIVAITSEGGFMAEMTAKIIRVSVAESEKYDAHQFVVIGAQGVEKMKRATTEKIVPVTGVEEKGLYKSTLEAVNYIIDEVEKGNIGKVFAVYPRAMSISFIKPVVVKLLPSEELVARQLRVKDAMERVIVESDINDIIHYLANVWLVCRLYEMLEDCVIAGFAAQSQQLEASLERLKKDQKGLVAVFKKAKRGDIDKSLREVFTASKITRGR